MSASPPDPSGPDSRGAGQSGRRDGSGGDDRPPQGRSPGSASGGGNRNGSGGRNRNRNRGGRPGGGPATGAKGGARAGGGSGGGGRGGNGRNGGASARSNGSGASGRSSSGTRGPSRSGTSRTGGARAAASDPPLVVAPVAPVGDRGGDVSDEAAIRSNRHKAIRVCLLPGVLAGIVVGIVLIAAGLPVGAGVGALVVVAAGVVLWLWQSAPKLVLRSIGARPSHEWELPRLYNLVDGLCASMGLPGPAICVVDSPVPNAMSIGHDPGSASLVVTSGLGETLTLVELEGVLAHELAHIKRHDTVLAGVAVVTTAPWSAVTGASAGADRVHRLIGRGREFDADQRAARVVRYPPGIGSALDTMVEHSGPSEPVTWPPGGGRITALTRWLWIDPMAGASAGESMEGNLDDTRVRAAALSLR